MDVLLVDDDARLRAALALWLTGRGCRVTVAAHGREAIDLFASGARPDVVLLDLSMPVLDGIGFLRERASRPEWSAIPVVVMTGERDMPPLTVPVLTKPASPADVMKVIARYGRGADETKAPRS